MERAEILTHLPGSDVHTALNVPQTDANVSLEQGCRVDLGHGGQDSAKKNLHFALEALQDVDLKGKHLRVELGGPQKTRCTCNTSVLSKPGLGHRPCGRRSAP